jgi:hypothetical protein
MLLSKQKLAVALAGLAAFLLMAGCPMNQGAPSDSTPAAVLANFAADLFRQLLAAYLL